jgi:predicted transcriptional regulator
MGTLTINVNDDIENRFRALAQKVYAEKKGYLGKAVTSAMQNWIDEIIQKKISESELKLMDKGFKMGKLKFKSREELYER